MKRRWWLAAVLALGTWASAQTLRIGLVSDPDVLDPDLGRTFVGRIVFASLCDKLFDITPDLEIVPQLAAGYTWSEDGRTLTLTLRRGVKFHDGEPFNAEAVKFNIERSLTLPGSNRRSEIEPIERAEVVDAYTVRIHLKTPFSPLIAQFADRAGMMVSPKAAEALGENFGRSPVCSGPFKFVERIAQDRIVLEKFEDYWNKDQIHFDRIVFLPIPDASVRLANLQSGDLDLFSTTTGSAPCSEGIWGSPSAQRSRDRDDPAETPGHRGARGALHPRGPRDRDPHRGSLRGAEGKRPGLHGQRGRPFRPLDP